MAPRLLTLVTGQKVMPSLKKGIQEQKLVWGKVTWSVTDKLDRGKCPADSWVYKSGLLGRGLGWRGRLRNHQQKGSRLNEKGNGTSQGERAEWEAEGMEALGTLSTEGEGGGRGARGKAEKKQSKPGENRRQVRKRTCQKCQEKQRGLKRQEAKVSLRLKN